MTATKQASGYRDFLIGKRQSNDQYGFEPIAIPNFLYDFQRILVEWAIRRGRAAIFADCGLGKTPMQLVWADNVVRKTNRPVLLLTPLSVGFQTVEEGTKFSVECVQSRTGEIPSGASVVVTNYENIHKFNSHDFAGCVADESSILKNYDGAIKAKVTEFMRGMEYRLLCTATAAPNDYIELGTSSECLGELGFMDMLSKFFRKCGPTTSRSDEHRAGVWRFRGHAKTEFWRWVCSWARAVRKPSDIGCEDRGFKLPPLKLREHVVRASTRRDGYLFDLPAVGLSEQRDERRRTIDERCEMAAELAAQSPDACVSWCHLNPEGDLLTKLIPGAVQISGADTEDEREEKLIAFHNGGITKLVSKPTITGYGMNWQHCCRQTFFPSHSFEQWYQAIRRSWRFGQTREVTVDMIASEGEAGVLANLRRKGEAADLMFEQLVELVGNELRVQAREDATKKETLPSWLRTTKK